MDKIDITMTATIRPKVLNRTLSSFCKSLLSDRDRFRLIINVDPVGENRDPAEVISVAYGYFEDIVFRIPPAPSFPMAAKWTWRQVKNKYVLHLEDDWILAKPINIEDLIEAIDYYPDLASLRLYKKKLTGAVMALTVNNFIYHNRKNIFLHGHKHSRGDAGNLSFNPTFIKGSFVIGSRKFMTTHRNPEKQFRSNNKLMCDFLKDWRHGIFGNPGEGPYVLDIGTKWRRKNKISKPGKGFIRWKTKT